MGPTVRARVKIWRKNQKLDLSYIVLASLVEKNKQHHIISVVFQRILGTQEMSQSPQPQFTEESKDFSSSETSSCFLAIPTTW